MAPAGIPRRGAARRGVADLVEAPEGGHLHEVVVGLARRTHQSWVERHATRREVVGAFALVNGLVSIAIMSAAAWVTGEPFVFPSLGPIAFLLFYRPLGSASSPRNTICGNAIGVLFGYAALVVFGLTHAGPSVAVGVSPARIGAAAFSLALTSGVMVWLGVAHPPAGATTLIVSLGILHTPAQVGVLMLGVILLTAQGLAINRLAGLDYPWWAPRRHPGDPRRA